MTKDIEEIEKILGTLKNHMNEVWEAYNTELKTSLASFPACPRWHCKPTVLPSISNGRSSCGPNSAAPCLRLRRLLKRIRSLKKNLHLLDAGKIQVEILDVFLEDASMKNACAVLLILEGEQVKGCKGLGFARLGFDNARIKAITLSLFEGNPIHAVLRQKRSHLYQRLGQEPAPPPVVKFAAGRSPKTPEPKPYELDYASEPSPAQAAVPEPEMYSTPKAPPVSESAHVEVERELFSVPQSFIPELLVYPEGKPVPKAVSSIFIPMPSSKMALMLKLEEEIPRKSLKVKPPLGFRKDKPRFGFENIFIQPGMNVGQPWRHNEAQRFTRLLISGIER